MEGDLFADRPRTLGSLIIANISIGALNLLFSPVLIAFPNVGFTTFVTLFSSVVLPILIAKGMRESCSPLNFGRAIGVSAGLSAFNFMQFNYFRLLRRCGDDSQHSMMWANVKRYECDHGGVMTVCALLSFFLFVGFTLQALALYLWLDDFVIHKPQPPPVNYSSLKLDESAESSYESPRFVPQSLSGDKDGANDKNNTKNNDKNALSSSFVIDSKDTPVFTAGGVE